MPITRVPLWGLPRLGTYLWYTNYAREESRLSVFSTVTTYYLLQLVSET